MTSLSIVIPCYNEENNLNRGVLNEVRNLLEKQNFRWEVLICNDASTDNSLKIITKFSKTYSGFSVLNLPHGGKPSAVWGGIQKAKYPIVLFTDMDQSTPLKEVLKLLPYFPEYDVVIGSRGISRNGFSLLRQIGGPIFLAFRRFFLLSNIIDTQCGFKMLKTDVAKQLFPNLAFIKDKSEKKGWRVSSFDVELLFMAQKWGHKIKEVVVDWRNEDTSNTKGGNGDQRYKKESIQMIKEIFRIKINDLKGRYATPQN
jgi:glycosyltransferase involved in cell wall biosynthesis